MKHIKTITIGIPAHNEEENIQSLLESLLAQDYSGYKLEQIFVVSDGSTDNTVKTVRNIHNKKIKVQDNKKRKGLGNTQNVILSKAKSDILVILNADIAITDKQFIKKLVLPIARNKADITSGKIVALSGKSFIEKVLETSKQFETLVYENFKSGNTIYTCNGCARAFSKKLYSTLRFPYSIGEDSYSYLYSVRLGHVYKFVKNAQIFYRLPGNFKDQELQSVRFKKSIINNSKTFGNEFTNSFYTLPKGLFFKTLALHTFKHPFYMTSYIALHILIKLKHVKRTNINDMWTVVESTKYLGTS